MSQVSLRSSSAKRGQGKLSGPEQVKSGEMAIEPE
jgi:hypothetical protein